MSLPQKLQKVVNRFASAPRELKGQALLRYANKVPDLPPEYAEDASRLTQVHECQSPFFLATEVDENGGVHLFFDCPPETPTVRGFAGIIREGLFAGSKLNLLGELLIPRIKRHDDVARIIVNKALRKNRNVVKCPKTLHLGPLLRAFLPDRVLGKIMMLAGCGRIMREWKGRTTAV